MCSKFQFGLGRTGPGQFSLMPLTGVVIFLLAGTDVLAQQADVLRPGLDMQDGAQGQVGIEDNGTQAPILQVQQTNNPQPLRLLSNQPRTLPPPPPPRRRQRSTDPFAPLGLRASSFLLFPVLEVTGVASDNVRSDNSGRLQDVGVRLAPSLRLQSDWNRHSLNVNASSEHVFYKKASDVDSNTINVSAALQLDIRRNTKLLTTANYQLSQTSSASSEVPGNAIGNRSDQEVSLTSAFSHRINRAIATVTGGISAFFYDDLKLVGGGKEDNSDREYIEPSARFRLGYEVSPAFIPFAEAGYTPRFHKKTRDRNGSKRNSQGLVASTGFGFNLTPIWDGEIALVFEHRNFEDRQLGNLNAIGVNATLNWRPSQLTTATLVSTTSVDESTTAGVSGVRNYDLSLAISHRLRENLTGNLNFGFNYDDFVGSQSDDMNFTAQVGFTYSILRELEWVANYQFSYFKSGTPDGDYRENRFTTGVRFRL